MYKFGFLRIFVALAMIISSSSAANASVTANGFPTDGYIGLYNTPWAMLILIPPGKDPLPVGTILKWDRQFDSSQFPVRTWTGPNKITVSTIAELSLWDNYSGRYDPGACLVFNAYNPLCNGIINDPLTRVERVIFSEGNIYSGFFQFSAFVMKVATAPASPTINSVVGGDKKISVAFSSGGDGNESITDYEYSLNGGAFTSAGTTTSPFTINGLNGRTAYSVTIKARNSIGLSSASGSLSARTTDASLDASEAEAARLAAAQAVVQADVAKKAKEQKELLELMAIIPSIAGISANIGDLGNSLLLKQKCVNNKTIKYVKIGAKCPTGYLKKK
jgi:hypothetical protein